MGQPPQWLSLRVCVLSSNFQDNTACVWNNTAFQVVTPEISVLQPNGQTEWLEGTSLSVLFSCNHPAWSVVDVVLEYQHSPSHIVKLQQNVPSVCDPRKQVRVVVSWEEDALVGGLADYQLVVHPPGVSVQGRSPTFQLVGSKNGGGGGQGDTSGGDGDGDNSNGGSSSGGEGDDGDLNPSEGGSKNTTKESETHDIQSRHRKNTSSNTALVVALPLLLVFLLAGFLVLSCYLAKKWPRSFDFLSVKRESISLSHQQLQLLYQSTLHVAAMEPLRKSSQLEIPLGTNPATWMERNTSSTVPHENPASIPRVIVLDADERIASEMIPSVDGNIQPDADVEMEGNKQAGKMRAVLLRFKAIHMVKQNMMSSMSQASSTTMQKEEFWFGRDRVHSINEILRRMQSKRSGK